jgi:hypothetical protein
MLTQALEGAEWNVSLICYIKLPGFPGWLVAGWLSRASRSATDPNTPSTNWLLRFYGRFFVGLSRLTDPVASRIAGLSVLAVAANAGHAPYRRTRAQCPATTRGFGRASAPDPVAGTNESIL